MNGWLRFVGTAAGRVLTALDLGSLGAEAKVVEALGENAAVAFVRGVAQHLEPGVAQFIAEHPALQGEFHTLTDDEAAAEVAQRKGNSDTGSASTDSSNVIESNTGGSSSTGSATPEAGVQTGAGQ